MVDSVQTDLFYTGRPDRARGGAVVGVAAKRLSSVDLPDRSSNQHEVGGVFPIREMLGDARIEEGRIRWVVLGDERSFFEPVDSTYTWYDARETQPKRAAEYRLYYKNPTGLEDAVPGDSLFLVAIATAGDPMLIAFVAPSGSTWENQLCWLFGFDPDRLEEFVVLDATDLQKKSGNAVAAGILEALELERGAASVEPSDFELVRRRFGLKFPTTWEFSAFAREEVGELTAGDPDSLLVGWLNREEQLFRALEDYMVREKLAEGFDDVDDFISFSLSVHNRRKSRMGFALENHLCAIFDANRIHYSHGAKTENNARPDFLFPGEAQYHDPDFPAEDLRMLGAKSNCKDRWRQVLSEANRIPHKHLCTLEPGISANQLAEMAANNLTLVVPKPVHLTYARTLRMQLLSVKGFLELVA